MARPPVGPEPAAALFDWDEAAQRTGADDAMLVELAELFLVECPRLLDTMQQGLATGRLAEVQRAAHTLKSSAALFLATTVQDAARNLEAAARDGDVETAAKLVQAVQDGLDRLLPALAARVQAAGTGTGVPAA